MVCWRLLRRGRRGMTCEGRGILSTPAGREGDVALVESMGPILYREGV